MRFVPFTSGRGCNARQVAIDVDLVHHLEAAATTHPATVVHYPAGPTVTVNGTIEAVAQRLERWEQLRADPPAPQPGPSLAADLFRERAQAVELANRAVCAMLEEAVHVPQRVALVEAKRRLVLLAADVLAGYWPAAWPGANGPGSGSVGAGIGAAIQEGLKDGASR